MYPDQFEVQKDGIDYLIEHLLWLNPTHIAIAWCWSSNCDLAIALRARGLFSKMLLNHDLKMITGNPDVRLTKQQGEILKAAQKEGGRNRSFFYILYSKGFDL